MEPVSEPVTSREEVPAVRAKLAMEVWERTNNISPDGLTWGNTAALGLLTSRRALKVIPATIPLVLPRALQDENLTPSSNLWGALRAITREATASAGDIHDDEGTQLRTAVMYAWCGWELFLLRWEHLISAARALRPHAWRSVTFGDLYGRQSHVPCYQGRSPLLQQILVNAAVERTGIIFLCGAGEKAADPSAVTLDDILAGRLPDHEMLRAVYKAPIGTASLDGVCFCKSVSSVPGVVVEGELVAVFPQAKYSVPTASTSTGKKHVEKSLDLLGAVDADAHKQERTLFGDRMISDRWRQRSVFVYACMCKVSSA